MLNELWTIIYRLWFLTPRKDWFVCQRAGTSTILVNLSDWLSQPSPVFLAPVMRPLPRRSPATGDFAFFRMSPALTGSGWPYNNVRKQRLNNMVPGSWPFVRGSPLTLSTSYQLINCALATEQKTNKCLIINIMIISCIIKHYAVKLNLLCSVGHCYHGI